MKELKTWAKKATFRYSGTICDGVLIEFGTNYRNKGQFSKDDLERMLRQFKGKIVPLGTQHTSNPVKGSLAEWIRNNINKNRIMTSYLGPILLHENYAVKQGKEIKFN